MRKGSAGGFTLWELMVVIALVVILLFAAIENLLPMRGAAERAAFTATVGNIRSAVGLEATRRVLDGDVAGLARMEGKNPIDWLAFPMSNYAGSIEGANTLDRGEWGFDTSSGTLLYRIRYPEYLEGDLPEQYVARFRVNVTRERNGQISSVRLLQLDDVRWKFDESEILRWLKDGRDES